MEFDRRVVPVPPGCVRAYHEEEWCGALVVVAGGEIELRCRAGGARRFAPGSLIWLDGLGLRTLANPGDRTTYLLAISRPQEE